MALNLILFAAGKAFKTAPNELQELKDSGKRQAQRFGVWMQEQGLQPEETISSPALRAVVAAEKALKAGGQGIQGIRTDDRLYSGKDLAGLVPTGPARTVMIVGHAGSLARLAADLCPACAELKIGKGTGIWLQREGDAPFRLAAEVQPEALPRGFPFPGPGASERRKRPAYYYTQSAVIPYRRTEEGVEILIISSSKGSHWVLPKGIHEPGLTARQSAAQEALEEAGIRGDVHEHSVGTWRQLKWGAVCVVETFAMEVTEVLDGDDWPEAHRQREWLAPPVAAQRIRNPELARLVASFTPA